MDLTIELLDGLTMLRHRDGAPVVRIYGPPAAGGADEEPFVDLDREVPRRIGRRARAALQRCAERGCARRCGHRADAGASSHPRRGRQQSLRHFGRAFAGGKRRQGA
jgi:hypothetical protein